MKKLLLTLACSVALAAAAFGQTTQSIKFVTSGTGANGTTSTSVTAGTSFSLDVYITLSGFNNAGGVFANGLSYWLQTNNALAPSLSITSQTYFTFTDRNQSVGTGNNAFVSTSGTDAGFMGENRDLGATTLDSTENTPNGTFQVATITFALNSSAPGGSYQIQSEVLSPHTSVIGDTNFAGHNLPQNSFALNVVAVPEPSTVVFMLGGVGLLAANFVRRSRRA